MPSLSEQEEYLRAMQSDMHSARHQPQPTTAANDRRPTARQTSAFEEPTLASVADPLELYVQCVQAPKDDAEFMLKTLSVLRPGVVPLVMREDFCGSAALCVEWAKSHSHRLSYGVDLDEETITWGHKRHLAGLSPSEGRDRVFLMQADVTSASKFCPKADLVVANNYSHFLFKTRQKMLQYFVSVHCSLAPGGVFVSDLYGGPEAQTVGIEDVEDYVFERTDGLGAAQYTYQWEQTSYNPINHDTVAKIQFAFADGSELKDKFVYNWRLWTVAELLELLQEAGFSDMHLFMEQFDESNESTGDYAEVSLSAPMNQKEGDYWRAYIFAGV